MWLIKWEDDTELDEIDVDYWDNVPRDKKIKNLKFKVPILGLDWESGPATRYLVAQVGLAVMSGQQKMVGYNVYYERDKVIYCLSVKYDGVKHRVITEDLGFREDAWRKGVLE